MITGDTDISWLRILLLLGLVGCIVGLKLIDTGTNNIDSCRYWCTRTVMSIPWQEELCTSWSTISTASVLEVGEGETVHFSLNGTSYEIDLNSAHAEELRQALEPYISAGRRAGSSGRFARSLDTKASWPQSRGRRDPCVGERNGYTLSERGRIPAAVVEAYNAAH